MGDPAIDNATAFAFEPLFLSNEAGRPVLVPAVRSTWDIGPAGLTLSEEQVPICIAGEPYGKPESSSYRYEPECLLPKPATDVVLVGSAVAPRSGTTELLVALQIGPLRKGVRVLGDRVFFRSMMTVGMTSPRAFERVPLQWERAFGGWDRTHADERKHACEYRNPVGVGFRPGGRFEEGLRCPNLEDPARPFKGWGDRPPPAGFGFVSPSWEPRRKLGGTCDEQWLKERAPLLPLDFTRRFLSSASPGLTAPGYLRGDEPVIAAGVTADPRGIAFRLPGVPPPTVTVIREGLRDQKVETRLDTVIVDTDAGKVFLLWKGELALRREPLEVRALRVAAGAGVPPGRAVA
jgi:hypothetical protein